MYRHVRVQPRETMTGDLTRQYLLRPEPLSHLVINEIFDLAAVLDPIRVDQALVRDFTAITVRQAGQTIVDLPANQLHYLNSHLWNFTSHSQNRGGANTTARGCYTILIPFGRHLYDENECLPAQPPGSTELTFTLTAQFGSMTTRIIEVEAVHLPNATPTSHLKYQERRLGTTEVSPNNDLDLPRGNQLIGIQVRQAVAPNLAAETGTITSFTIIADETDHQIIDADWFSIWAHQPYRQALRWLADEQATENRAAAYTQDAFTRSVRSTPGLQSEDPMQYCYLDLDPTKDGKHAINTLDFQSLKLRMNSQQAGEVRILPIEVVTT